MRRAGTESVELLRMSDKGREVYVHASLSSIYLEYHTLENAKVDTSNKICRKSEKTGGGVQ